MMLPRETWAAVPSRAALIASFLVLLATAGFAQDDYPVEVSGVELRNGDTSGTVTLRTESAVEWSVELAERQLVLFMPRAVPGPEALDRSSRAGLISLVEVGFAVPDSVPTTRITVHLREAFEHSVERFSAGVTVKLRAVQRAREPKPPVAVEAGSGAGEADRLRDENEQLRQRVTELHEDRLKLRSSLQRAEAQLSQRERAQESAAAAAAAEESARLGARNQELEAELAGARSQSEALRQQMAQLESRIAAMQEADSGEELAARLEQAESRERDLARSLRRSQEAERTLRGWLSRAPSVLGASDFVVAPGDGCLPLRPEPDPAGVELGCLAPGSSVAALSFRPDWLRVRGPAGKEGWVPTARLAPPQARSVQDLAEARRDLEVAREREESLERELRAARAGVNLGGPVVSRQADPCLTLRESPRADSRRLDCLAPGTAVAVLDAQGDWISVTVGESDAIGWVAKRFVTSAAARETSDQIASLEADRQAMEARVATLTEQLQAARADAASKATEAEELTARLLSAGQSSDARLAELEAEVALKTAELVESRDRLATLERESQARVAELETEAARSAEEFASLRASRESADREAAERMTALEGEIARKATELSELNSRLESSDRDWRERIAQLEARVDRERAEAFSAFGPGRVVIKEETDPCLSLRAEPKVDSQTLDCLQPGTQAEALSMAGEWLRLRLDDGREGWSAGSFLESTAEVERRGRRDRELEASEALRAELAETQAKLAASRSTSEDLLLQVAALEASASELEGASAELAENRSANEALRSQVATLEASQAELEAAKAELAATRSAHEELKTQVAALEASQAELGTASVELSASQTANEELRLQVASLEASLEASEAKLGTANAELVASLTESEEQRSRLASLEASQAELEQAQAELAASRSANGDLLLQVAELEAERAELEEAVRIATAAAAAVPSVEGPSEEELALKNDLEASRSELIRARREIADLSDRATLLEADLAGARDELTASRASNEELSVQVGALEREREELQSVVAEATSLQVVDPPLPDESDQGPSEAELALQADLLSARAAQADAEARGLDLERRLASLEEQLLEVTAELAASRANNEGLAGEVAALKTLSRELREALETAVAPSPSEPLEPLATGEIAESDLPPTPEPMLEVSDAPPVPADLQAFAKAWARAWSGQRVEDYLSFYASTFVPSDGSSRSEWEELRRQRLTAPTFIEVELSDFRTRIDSATRAMVAFEQRYRSNTFEDRVVKTLELVREGDLWKILSEVAE